jgi:hypothetical protein
MVATRDTAGTVAAVPLVVLAGIVVDGMGA